MKVSGRFARTCLLTVLYLPLTIGHWSSSHSAHNWNFLDYRKSPKLAVQDLHDMAFPSQTWGPGGNITTSSLDWWILLSVEPQEIPFPPTGRRSLMAPMGTLLLPLTTSTIQRACPPTLSGWVLLHLSGWIWSFLEETFVIKKHFTLKAVFTPWSRPLLTFSWLY